MFAQTESLEGAAALLGSQNSTQWCNQSWFIPKEMGTLGSGNLSVPSLGHSGSSGNQEPHPSTQVTSQWHRPAWLHTHFVLGGTGMAGTSFPELILQPPWAGSLV